MKQPLALMFDLGGVLIENDTFSRLQALLPYAMPVAELKQKWLKSDAVRRFELGQYLPQEFAQAFLLEWSLPLTEQTFLAEFMSWPKGYYPGALAMLQALRQSYRLVCLSNSNVLHWSRFGRLDQDFDLALSSHLLGAIKPDPAAFAMALAQSQATPDEVWYFDDAQVNVLAAASMGIKAFHTDGFDALQATLRAHHIL